MTYDPHVAKNPITADEWNARLRRNRTEEFFQQVGVGYAILTPVLIVLLIGGGGAPLGFLLAVALGPGLTMMVTSLIGLPIRLVPGIRRWWIRYGEIAMAGIVLSLGLVAYGYATGHEATYPDPEVHGTITAYEPDGAFVLPGWLLLTFFATHAWIPPRWKKNRLGGSSTVRDTKEPYVSHQWQSPEQAIPAGIGAVPLWAPYYGASIGEAVKRFFKKYAMFSGRASRSEYWWWYLVSFAVGIVLGVLMAVLSNASAQEPDAYGYVTPDPGAGSAAGIIIWILWLLAILLPTLALTVRRLHDANLNGSLVIIGLVPFLGGMALLVLALLPSKLEGRRFDVPV
ncbi:DUF805 domain-containing protein [Arthrobacter bambusae]|uniref:Uncharacterized membrane protein YhaH (DUF805 family) n=1 Tax=Arthrobacter bambusae TaxID=1338426 RepID=A0AAW8DD98_9MICC|nr:DUF805 domain-containing protein [Arthrobacter bambusae]MDP9903265.1 uncharacterized membrane protein YhaH (DUF805 family) [Arthrobacter bambusae]MDQ0128741.1 uncharacterized membrane protein YhaH (DUF805 family) [Arthrobacter bambusae]MDQ0180082.1 uncharacterized membrane protein YhaH (DUF805 family) [Arthrobacter bambusae]